jgi:predicted HNH restriction endonuclease
MRGVHYVTVKQVGRTYIHVHHAWSMRNFKVLPKDLIA